MNILSIDVGTTSMRGMLFDERGGLIRSASRQTPLIRHGERIEQSPALLKDYLRAIVREITEARKADAITITAFRSAPLLARADGEPLSNFIMWQDKRNLALCEELREGCADLPRRCGAALSTVFTAPKLTYIKRNEPELWARADKAAVVPDYLIHDMTGEWVTDHTYGSRTLLLDGAKAEWSDELCARFEIDKRKLCRLIEPGSIAGYTKGDFCRECGISEGIPVISAGGDQQCAALGSGVLNESAMLINCGTGAYALTCASAIPEPIPGISWSWAALPGKYLTEAMVPSCADRLNAMLKAERPDMTFDELNTAVEKAYSGAEDDAFAKKALSLYKQIAGDITDAVARFPGHPGGRRKAYISGGLSASGIYDRILSAGLGQPLYRWRNVQATAIGAFASAAVTLGVYDGHEAALSAVRAEDTCDIYG